MGAEVGGGHAGCVPDTVGQDGLAAVGHGHHPRRLVDGGAEVVGVALLGLAQVQPDPHRQLRPASPVHAGQGHLDRFGALDRLAGPGEGGGERVAGRGEDVPVELGDGVGEDLVVDPQRRRHRLGIGGPQPGRSDHIGEQEGDGPRGEVERLARHGVTLADLGFRGSGVGAGRPAATGGTS